MISLRRLFGLMLLFLFFEAVVAVVTTFAWPNVSVFLACLAMTGLAVGVWVIFALVTRIMTRPRAATQASPQAKVTTLPSPRPSAGDDAFALEMTALVREANRRLIGAGQLNAKREQPTVATLPLFLVMGAEGAGKTSALVNSGLEPHLLAGEASREGVVLPTRACNLWLAEGSVFADISGRVAMQEPEHWEKALRILSAQQRVPRWKKILFGRQGPQPNLKGVVVVADTNLFVRAPDPQRISAFARSLNDRLQTVGTVFGKDFPVYVLFSKCDALESFPEFFAHLSEAEGRRLVGVTLPLMRPKNESADIYADREGKRLTDYFNRLYMSLADKRMVFLAREEELRKKSLGYEFPRELKKLRGELVQFLLDAFRSSPLQQGSRLRGFYFAGQRYVSRAAAVGPENSVADFSVVKRRTEATILFGSKPQPQPMAPSRAAAPEGTIAKWTFLTEVFHDVILKDRAGNTAPRVDTREQSYRHLAFGAVGAVFLILSLLWVNSWRNNRQLLDDVESAVGATSIAPPTAATPIAITELESLREPLVRLLGYQRHGAPPSYRWGLYSGSDVTAELDHLYFDRFRRIFVTPVVEALTGRFLSLQPNAPVQDEVDSLLKAYRMVTSQACPPDDTFLNTALMPVWTSAVSAQPDSTPLAEKQMEFYVAELKIQNPYKAEIRENSEAVGKAQAYLQNLNGPDKFFHALIAEVNRTQQPDSLSRYASNYSEVMTGPNSIDGVYTRDGWQAMIDNIHSHKASAGEPCVVGSTSAVSKWSMDASTDRDLQDLYVKSYVQHWKSFFEAHHVVSFSNTADASRKLRILADNNRSPLLGLIYMASHDTNVVAPATAVSKAEEGIEQGAASVRQTFSNLVDKYGNKKDAKATDQLIPQPSLGSAEIMREFEPVHAMVDPASSEKWLNDKNQEYVKALENLSNALAAIPPKIDKSAAADKQLLDQANQAVVSADTALHSLKGSFPNEPSQIDLDLGNLLEEPIRYASAAIGKTPAKPIPLPPPPPDFRPVIARINRAENELCSSLAPLLTKFPFDATSSLDATTQDLNQVFAPTTGTLAQFEQSPDVSQAYARQGKIWASKADFPATYSQPFLQELNSLGQLREALYADGGTVPHFDYTLTLDGTGKISFELDVDGHAIKYTPGKGSVQKLVWPPVTAAPTQLDVKTGFRFKVGQKDLPLAQLPGPWGLFRLLQAADDQNGGLFTFRSLMFANTHTPLQDSKGNPATIQIRIDSAASNIFGRGYFSKLRCEGWWAVQLAHAQP